MADKEPCMWARLRERGLVTVAENLANSLQTLLDGYCIVCHRSSGSDLAVDCLELVCKECYGKMLEAKPDEG